MSIFPKRTIAGGNVTIHWNLNTSDLVDEHLFPYIRIGVIDPSGKTTMLFEKHIPVLPSIGSAVPAEIRDEKTLLYLNKNLPLLLLADYLSGRQKKEKLIEILKNIYSGRHYYFTYSVAPDAIPGKYSLLSEIYIDGTVNYSGTASEDFFYVDNVSVYIPDRNDPLSKTAVLTNHSSEPVPVKILSYEPGKKIGLSDIKVFEMKPNESIPVQLEGQNKYLSYNEERIVIPLYKPTATRCIRNQQWLPLYKNDAGEDAIYIMHKDLDISYKLQGATKDIWLNADGLATRNGIQNEKNREAYDEMLANGLIIEI